MKSNHTKALPMNLFYSLSYYIQTARETNKYKILSVIAQQKLISSLVTTIARFPSVTFLQKYAVQYN